MPVDIQHNVHTNFIVSDQSTKGILAVQKAAQGVTSAFDKATSFAGNLASAIGVTVGAVSFAGVIKEAAKYTDQVGDLADLMEQPVEKVDGMLHYMRQFGMETDAASRTMMMLSRQGARIEDSLAVSVSGAQSLSKRFALVGVDISKGPVSSLEQMSAAVAKGQLDAGRLMSTFRIPQQQAADMMDMLKAGPKKMKEAMDQLVKSGAAVTNQNKADFERMDAARKKVLAGWHRIQVVIGKELFPALANLMDEVATQLPTWLEHAKRFGSYLRENMAEILAIAKATGKVLLANYAIQKLSALASGGGQSFGLVGGAQKAGAFLKGQVASSIGGVGRSLAGAGVMGTSANTQAFHIMRRMGFGQQMAMGKVATPALSEAISRPFKAMFGAATHGGGLRGGMSAFATSLSKVVPSGLGGFFRNILVGVLRLRPIVTGLLRLGGIGTLIAFVVKGVYNVFQNVGGIRDYLSDVFGRFMVYVDMIVEPFKEIGTWISNLFGSGSDVWEILGNAIPLAVGGLMEVIIGIMRYIKVIGGFVANLLTDPRGVWREGMGKVWDRLMRQALEDEAERMDARARSVPAREADKATRQIHNDFRGSHFSITQKFAEGFDPDRIALAFTNDLAMMGDYKLGSGYAPAGAGR